jgi:hypothetical protein
MLDMMPEARAATAGEQGVPAEAAGIGTASAGVAASFIRSKSSWRPEEVGRARTWMEERRKMSVAEMVERILTN